MLVLFSLEQRIFGESLGLDYCFKGAAVGEMEVSFILVHLAHEKGLPS